MGGTDKERSTEKEKENDRMRNGREKGNERSTKNVKENKRMRNGREGKKKAQK